MGFLAVVRIFIKIRNAGAYFAYFYRAHLFVLHLKAVGADSCPKKYAKKYAVRCVNTQFRNAQRCSIK